MNEIIPYSPKRLKKIGVIDIEGFRDFKKEKMIPYLFGVFNPNESNSYQRFRCYEGYDCVDKFVEDYLRHKFRGFNFYAHHGSIFDFPLILDSINRLDKFNIYPIMTGSRIIKLKVTDNTLNKLNKKGCKSYNCWNFLDSGALLNFSLNELTKTFDVKHKKLKLTSDKDDYDAKLFELYKKDPEKIIEYLKHDCMGLYEVLDKFKNQMLGIGGDLGLTIASTSLKTFNRKYQHGVMYRTNKLINDETRHAYFGGRTEIFRMYAPEKNGCYYYYDVNSLYPYVMLKNTFPVSKPTIIRNPKKNIYMDENGITNAVIKSPDELYIPLLPHKINMGGAYKLMYVLGKYEGWWDNHFLRKAKELGYKISPMKSYVFQNEYIFKDFVSDMYKIKQNSDRNTPSYLIAKLMMNSLYGKFGQREISESFIKDDNIDIEKYKVLDFDIDTGWSRVQEIGKGKYYLPHISIHVTALAQLLLFNTIDEIIKKGYRVYYIDTDSIITDYPNLKVSSRLGDWKLEKKITEAFFVLPKTYKTVDDSGKTEIRAKGYTREMRNKITDNAYKRAVIDNDLSGFKVVTAKKGMLRPKNSFRRFGEFNHIDFSRKSLRTIYNKRKILKDFNTLPFHIKEII